jgi:hypothetical protein
MIGGTIHQPLHFAIQSPLILWLFFPVSIQLIIDKAL